jgi:hypothetical protein
MRGWGAGPSDPRIVTAPGRIPGPWASALILTALVFCFYAPLFSVSSDHRAYLSGDFVTHVFPFREMMSRLVREGSFPLWNPYVWSGHPAVGDASPQTFYPLKAISFWFEGRRLYLLLEALAIAHLLLGGAFMHLLMRVLGVGRAGAVAAAVVFMLNGYFEAHLNHSNLVESAVWLPGILAYLLLSLRSGRPRYVAAAGFCLGMSLLASFVEVVFYMLVAVSLFIGLHHFAGRWRKDAEAGVGPGRTVAIWAAVLCLGFGIGAIQLLPMYELSRLSTHTRLTFAQATQLSTNPEGLLSILMPRVAESRSMAYCGSFALVLAFLGVWLGPRRRSTPFVGLAFISLALALGRHSPVYGALYALVPGVDCFRTPERWLLLHVFAVAALAGLGADVLAGQLRAQTVRVLRWVRNLLPALIVIGTAAALLVHRGALSEQQARYQLAVFAIVLSAAAAVLSVRIASSSTARFCAIATICLLSADAFVSLRGVNLGREDPFVLYEGVQEVAAVLAADREPYRVANMGRELNDNWFGMVGLEHTQGDGPMEVLRYKEFLAQADANPQIVDVLNTKYFLWGSRVRLANPDSFPRAFLVHRYLIERDPASMLSHLGTPGAVDLRSCVAFEHEPGDVGSVQRVGWEAGARRPLGTLGTADVIDRRPGALQIRTRGESDAFLVLSEVFYPGWEATLDGRTTPILRADYTLRGIYVPAGEHHVSLRYRPRSFRIGAGVTGLFALFCLALAGWRRKEAWCSHTPRKEGRPARRAR